MRPVAVMAKEILPNLSTPLMVETGLRLTYSIIVMSGLAFLGLGIGARARPKGRILAGIFICFESFLNRLGAPGASNLFRLMA